MSNTCAAARYFQFSFGTYRSLSPAVDLLWNSPAHYTARVISASQDCPASFQGPSAHVNDELSKKALKIVGADIVKFSPTYDDAAERTAITATQID